MGNIVKCFRCGKEFNRKPFAANKSKHNFCCKECYTKFQTGKPSLRRNRIKKNCEICGKEMMVIPAEIKKRRFCSFKCKYIWFGKTFCGENHPRWKGDKCKKKNERSDPAYQNWVSQIKRRDGWKCRISNQDCSGYCIVHHILSWKDYPELRYNINNGITLCQAHHPRKRAEEKRLIPFFQGLVPVSN